MNAESEKLKMENMYLKQELEELKVINSAELEKIIKMAKENGLQRLHVGRLMIEFQYQPVGMSASTPLNSLPVY